jgi:phosphonate transport system substrate-binding protein
VYLVTAPDYEGVIKLLVDGKIDAAWVGTGAYVKAAIKGVPVEPVVTPVRNGKYYYNGAIICRKDKGYKKITDLKGKSVAFVDPSSASGYIFPKALFELNGLSIPKDLLTREPGKVDFLKKHDTVAIAVYLGKYDAGAVYNNAIDNVFKGQPDKLKEMMVLALTDKIVSEPILVRSNMNIKEKQRIKSAFLSLSFNKDQVPVELGGLEGFKAVNADMYKDVIKALTR